MYFLPTLVLSFIAGVLFPFCIAFTCVSIYVAVFKALQLFLFVLAITHACCGVDWLQNKARDSLSSGKTPFVSLETARSRLSPSYTIRELAASKATRLLNKHGLSNIFLLRDLVRYISNCSYSYPHKDKRL